MRLWFIALITIGIVTGFCTFSVDLTKQNEIRGLLEKKSRIELQILAKRHNVDGRRKNVTIIEELIAKLTLPAQTETDAPKEVESSVDEFLQPLQHQQVPEQQQPLVLDDTPMSDDLVNAMADQGLSMQDLIHLQRMSGGVFTLLNRKDHDRSPEALEAKRLKQLSIKEKKRLMMLEARSKQQSEASSSNTPNDAEEEEKATVPLMMVRKSSTSPIISSGAPVRTSAKSNVIRFASSEDSSSEARAPRMIKQLHVDRRTMDEEDEQNRKKSLAEATLKEMLVTLIEKQGFDSLFKATGLRCFDTSKPSGNMKPTMGGALKLLRQSEMDWARRRLEDLYLREMSPSAYKPPPRRSSSPGDQYKYGVQSSGKKWERSTSQAKPGAK